jgi:hypothetical protein
MKTEQQLKNNLVLVFGRICSGKGSYKNDPEENARIVVSDVVRALVKSSDRNVLQDTLQFDQAIAHMLINRIELLIKMDMWSNIIVDGIRQPSIVQKVLDRYPEAELVWLEVPVEERRRRYNARKDEKDVEDFDVADNKQIELECQKILDIFKDKLTIINNY